MGDVAFCFGVLILKKVPEFAFYMMGLVLPLMCFFFGYIFGEKDGFENGRRFK